MLDYINFLDAKHRAILNTLKTEGKSYRSQKVSFENGYLTALRDIKDAIEQPQKDAELKQAIKTITKRLS